MFYFFWLSSNILGWYIFVKESFIFNDVIVCKLIIKKSRKNLRALYKLKHIYLSAQCHIKIKIIYLIESLNCDDWMSLVFLKVNQFDCSGFFYVHASILKLLSSTTTTTAAITYQYTLWLAQSNFITRLKSFHLTAWDK